MQLQQLIDRKNEAAKFMVDKITYIIKNFETRAPGSKGEEQCARYMADYMKNECGCEYSEVESFREHPGAFFGWIYITVTFALASIILFFFMPIVSVILIVVGLTLAVLEFGLYKKAVDWMFPEKTGHSVTAIKKCSGETKRRVFFDGHIDATWEWPVNYYFGGVAFEAHAMIGFAGAFYYLILSIVYMAKFGIHFGMIDKTAAHPFYVAALAGLVFVPFLIGLYFLSNERRVVDGANDNLSGCYMGITILKELHDAGITLENTEVGVILAGSEESGLRGAQAWAQAHEHDYDDVPTFIYSYDTIYDPKYLMVNYRNINATIATDKEVGDLFYDAAQEIGVHCTKGMVPPMGGATNGAAYAQKGFRATDITGLNHKLENYYHTRRDTYDNMNEKGLADCYAASVKVLEKIDNGALD
ncbi:MAG: M20/M25/M40 family metallo-hydrolase [Clostridia bacterium]|nr:M20/M25/M40 family metallo-hydrolase [Clostridia bacterium]